MSIDFVDSLKNHMNGTSFLGIDCETQVPLRGGKANPMLGRVVKRTTGSNVMIFANKFINGYDAQVRRRLVAEGKDPNSFVLSPRKWGERVPGLPLIRHVKDGVEKFYLEVIFIKAGEVQYFLDGVPIDKKDIVGLPETENGEQGGLDNKVIIRAYAMDSLRVVRMNKTMLVGNFEVVL